MLTQQISTKDGTRSAGPHVCVRALILAIFAELLTGCESASNTPSMLDVHGTGARIISNVWWIQLWTGTAIVLLITSFLIAIVVRHRGNHRAEADLREGVGNQWIWFGGIVLPLVVLLLMFPYTVGNSWALSAPPSEESDTITVIGHRWWWEVRYPEDGFSTANQLYIPVGESVEVNVTSEDVIHSFWVPQLHFKRDLIPGKMNTTWLHAEDAGTYRGICSEFCGQQHAKMMFMVNAVEPEEYQEWVASQRAPAHEPEDDLTRRGKEVFLGSTCVYCHTVRGTPAAGETGPDLTHFAGRQTIAAGALENNRGNLGGWIMDPQHIKTGSAMPPAPLTGEELQALLAYLESLQ